MKTISIEDVARRATQAALTIIDEALDGTSKRGRSPCGDELAFELDARIQLAMEKQFRSAEHAPAFVRAKEIDEYQEAK